MVRLSASFFIFLSFVSTALTIANAFFLKKQFYPSVVYLTKSNTSMAVIYFQAAVFSYLLFSLLRLIFFGQLRVSEIEHVQERVWHAILETCLAFTVFRDDFSPKFVVQFVVLLFVKAFHWLAEDRVDYMERSPVITVLYHARIMGILSLISAVDSYFISYAFFTTLVRGASAQVVFGFEYAILLTVVAHIAIKYILHIHDLRSAHPWENKAVYMLYAELFVNFLRCLLYMLFAIVMFKIHTLPLFVIRPFYSTLRSLQKAVNDVVQSRRAINAMNNLFPLATEQELIDGDNTCIICREEMTVESGAKKLPCNHIFHPNCLRSWFQRQQTCPTCRSNVLSTRSTANATGAAAAARAAFGGVPPNVQFNFGAQPNFFNPMANMGGFAQFGGFPFQQQQQNQQPQPEQNQGNAAGVAPNAGTTQPNAQLPQQQQQNLMFGRFMPFNNNMFPMAFPPLPPPPFFGMPPPILPQFMRFPPTRVPEQQQAAGTSSSTAEQADSEAQNESPGTSESTQQATGVNESNNAAGSTGAQQSSASQQQSASFMPSFGTSPLFSFPQPPSFAGFSDAEVLEMEGRERSAVEARVQALRNISVLLDAAMLQFQQYLSIALTPTVAPTSSTTSSTNTSTNQSTTEPVVVPPSSSSPVRQSKESDEKGPKLNDTNKTEPAASSSTAAATASDGLQSTSANDGVTSSDEIRQRRLEKFGAS